MQTRVPARAAPVRGCGWLSCPHGGQGWRATAAHNQLVSLGDAFTGYQKFELLLLIEVYY